MAKIGIVGSGLIGRAWATIFASHGFEVALYDAVAGAAAAARKHIGRNLKELAGHGLVEDPAASLKRIRLAADLADAVKGADLVQENGPETVEAKRSPLRGDGPRSAALDCILASSTSFIVASRFADGLPGEARCLVAHPVNPPHLVPIVELAPAPWTDPAVVARARKAIYEQAGQVPIELRKEKPGFVLNRLQAVLLAEAFRIVGEGVCSAAGRRQDDPRRPRPALVLHGAVRDDRAERARRHRRLLRALRPLARPRWPSQCEGLGNPFGTSECRDASSSNGAMRPVTRAA